MKKSVLLVGAVMLAGAVLAVPPEGMQWETAAIQAKIDAAAAKGGGRVTVESHVLDCDMDLYGKNVRTEFWRFIRPERRFGSLEELKAAIAADTEKVREIK